MQLVRFHVRLFVLGSSLSLPAMGLLLPGCGPSEADDPRVVSEIAPVQPTGTLAGAVYDAATGAPLEGVEVALPQLATAPVTTDADGGFRVEKVPASAHLAVRYHLDGYARAHDEVDVPSSAGNLAQDNGVGFSGPIGLFALIADGADGADGLVADVAVEGPDGEPVDASVTATLSAAWLSAGAPAGSLTVAGEGGAAPGRYALLGLPDLAALASVVPDVELRIVVAPEDPALRPAVLLRTVTQAASERLVVARLEPVVPPASEAPPYEPDTPLEVIASNVMDLVGDEAPVLPSVVGLDDTLQIAFNRPVAEPLFFATVVDGKGRVLSATPSVSGGSLVELSLGGQPEGAGARVFIEAHVDDAAVSGLAPVQRSGYFLTPPAGGALGFAPWDASEAPHSLHAPGAAGTLRCPTQAGELTITLNGRVGGRGPGGAALPPARFLPVRVTSLGAPQGNQLDPASGEPPLVASLAADGPVAASGYTTRLTVPWPGVGNATVADDTFDYQLRLEFNDLSLAAASQDQVVRAPGGAPVGVLEGTITIRIAAGCP